MAAFRTLLRYIVQQGLLLTLGGVLMPLSGCATGSSASFTQAPLLFAEQTDSIATDPASSERVAMAVAPSAQPTPTYVDLIGNGVSLPTATVTAVTRPLRDALTQVATALPISVKEAPAGAVASVGAPTADLVVQAGLLSGTITVAVQTGALPPINVQANVPDAVSTAVAAVTQVATKVPVVLTVLQSPPVAGLGNAVGGMLGQVGSTSTALLQPVAEMTSPIASIASKSPVVPGATAVGVAQSVAVTGTSLLTATSTTLGKICVLKGCR